MHIKKSPLKGSLTVEAALLMPVLIVVTIILIFLVIYAYDRALLVQDTEYIMEVAREAEYSHQETIERAAYNAYKTVKEQHPYLSFSNIGLTVSCEGLYLSVSLEGEWMLPIMSSLNRQISATCKTMLVNPMDAIYMANDLLETIERVGENADQ